MGLKSINNHSLNFHHVPSCLVVLKLANDLTMDFWDAFPDKTFQIDFPDKKKGHFIKGMQILNGSKQKTVKIALE